MSSASLLSNPRPRIDHDQVELDLAIPVNALVNEPSVPLDFIAPLQDLVSLISVQLNGIPSHLEAGGGGSCFPKSAALGIAGDTSLHRVYRLGAVETMRTHRDIFEPLVLNQEDCSFDVYCTKQSLDSCYMTNSIIIALAIYLKVIIYVYRQAYKDVKKPDIYKDDIHGVSKNTTNYPVTRRILNHEIECFQITPNDLVSGQPLLIYSIQSPASIGYEHYQLLDVIAPEILVSETIQAYDVIDGRDVAVRVSVIPSAPSPAPISIAFALPDIVSPLDLMDVDVVEQVFSFLIKVIEEEESIPEINLPSWCMLLNNNYSRNRSLIELADIIL